MKSKNIIILLLVLVTLAQLLVPAKMMWDREDVIGTGKMFKFKTAPVDPTDPFRGKYITLDFESDTWPVDSGDWEYGETAFVTLKNNADGFAEIAAVSRTKPDEEEDYVKAKVRFFRAKSGTAFQGPGLTVDYPFDKYYMEESEAREAELIYQKSAIDSASVTYALVRVKEGRAVLIDVLVDGVSIDEVILEE